MINGVLKQNLRQSMINGVLKQNLTSIHDQWSSKTKSKSMINGIF